MDDGFSYEIPESLDVAIGSIVRVPLGGRRVRGWVTGIRSEERSGLKEITGVSGARPVFDDRLLQTLRWAAVHYVAPLSVLLARAAPPNLPKAGRVHLPDVATGGDVPTSIAPVAEALAAGRRPATSFVAGSGPWTDEVISVIAAATTSGQGAMVLLPTAQECAALANRIGPVFGDRLVWTASSASPAARTMAWSQAAGSPGTIVVGTPEIALWPIAGLGIAVVIGEGRRAMKARQSPTLHVRELVRRRSTVERFGLVMLGAVPTLEAVGMGIPVAYGTGRTWPLVEIIDRTTEPPSSAPLSEGTRSAIAGAVRRNEPAFVFVSRRGYTPATRCSSCGELRRCPQCGSNPGRGALCERCETPNGPCAACGGSAFVPLGVASGRVLEDLRRLHGRRVSAPGEGGLIQVGTERDTPPPGTISLAVVVDADSMLLRPHFRAEEDTLRIIARVAGSVRRGRGNRCVIQTRMPSHRVLQALRHGTAADIVPEWLAERERDQLPPQGELLAVEITEPPAGVDEELRAALGGDVGVFGPAQSDLALRWLVQAPDLRRAKIQLRSRVQSWRDRGATVRVDADPLDV